MVWIAEIPDEVEFGGGWWAVWNDEDAQETLLESLESQDLERALAWGRQRAVIVMVRRHASEYFSAGDEAPPWWPDVQRWPDR